MLYVSWLETPSLSIANSKALKLKAASNFPVAYSMIALQMFYNIFSSIFLQYSTEDFIYLLSVVITL